MACKFKKGDKVRHKRTGAVLKVIDVINPGRNGVQHKIKTDDLNLGPLYEDQFEFADPPPEKEEEKPNFGGFKLFGMAL